MPQKKKNQKPPETPERAALRARLRAKIDGARGTGARTDPRADALDSAQNLMMSIDDPVLLDMMTGLLKDPSRARSLASGLTAPRSAKSEATAPSAACESVATSASKDAVVQDDESDEDEAPPA